LDSGTCVFVYLIAKDLFGKRIALITGIAAALYVGLFIWTGWLYSETLYTFFLTALLFSLSRLQQMMLLAKIYKDEYKNVSKAELLYVVASGLLLGLTLLIRPNGIILIGLLFLWVALIGKVISWKTKLKNILIILLISTIINVPWLYRNYQVTHTLIPISTIGTTLIGNYNDTVFQGDHVIRGMWLPPANTVNPDFHNYTPADEQKDTSRVINWMRTHINEVPILLGLHLLNMWTPYLYAHGLPFEQFPNRLTSKFMLYFIPTISIPVFLLAFVGLLVTWSYRRKQLLLIYLMITLTILQNIAFYGSPRYRAPIEPLLIILAGGAFWCFMRYRLRNSSDGQGDDTTPQGN
jgi:4-amino-4-deoxy-L-arabinose transferase-like glycosyltransferase